MGSKIRVVIVERLIIQWFVIQRIIIERFVIRERLILIRAGGGASRAAHGLADEKFVLDGFNAADADDDLFRFLLRDFAVHRAGERDNAAIDIHIDGAARDDGIIDEGGFNLGMDGAVVDDFAGAPAIAVTRTPHQKDREQRGADHVAKRFHCIHSFRPYFEDHGRPTGQAVTMRGGTIWEKTKRGEGGEEKPESNAHLPNGAVWQRMARMKRPVPGEPVAEPQEQRGIYARRNPN